MGEKNRRIERLLREGLAYDRICRTNNISFDKLFRLENTMYKRDERIEKRCEFRINKLDIDPLSGIHCTRCDEYHVVEDLLETVCKIRETLITGDHHG